VSPRALLLLAAASVLWGFPYLLMKIAVEDGVPPAVLVVVRSLVGALALLPFALRSGALRGLRGRWRPIAVLAALDMSVPFFLIAAGEREVSSSLAGILIATVPLLIALLAVPFAPAERVHGTRLAGLVLGFLGVAVLLGVEVAGDSGLIFGSALILLASLSYAAATLYLRSALAGVPSLTIVVGTLFAAAAMTVPVAVPAAVGMPSLTTGAALSLLALGVFCSGLAYLAFYALVAEVGAARASINTYLSPAIAVLAGVLLLGESFTASAVAGMLLILAGSWIASGGPPPWTLLSRSGAAARARSRARDAPPPGPRPASQASRSS
jgi:drug/metabolite transporter (DMT)-like permease